MYAVYIDVSALRRKLGKPTKESILSEGSHGLFGAAYMY